MPHLALFLLGPLQVLIDGRPATGFVSAKVRALLAYLAVEAHQPHPRDSLTALLWPDWPDRHARNNLRQALANLRAVIRDSEQLRDGSAAGGNATPPPFLLIDRESVQFNRASEHSLDVAVFEQGVRGRGAGEGEDDAILRLAGCVGLYRGPFLEGFAVSGSAPFEQWLTLQREHWQRAMLAALAQLAELYEQGAAYSQAQACARRALALEPTDERWQRQLMRALALGGDRSAALVQYEACARVMQEELGVEPAPETIALYEQIRHGPLVASPSAIPPCVSESPCHRVSEPPRPLIVARQQELTRLDGWLDEALRGQGRVGFVLGEPGTGKTVLLREFAQRAMEAQPELVVAGGNCKAYAGVGDPYLPFAEIMRLLVGDVEARHAAGALSSGHTQRLRDIAPVALQQLLDVAPALIDVLLPSTALLQRARELEDRSVQVARVREALDHRQGVSSQAFLFDQATRLFQVLAQSRPLLLILDDLQWSDAPSIGFLFHLVRRLAGHRILILGAYRPEEVAAGRDGGAHPLQAALYEWQALWEDVTVDLARADGRAFVDALVDSEPNRLGREFREALYRHTEGHALFSVELLRGLQQRGDLLRDAQGCWVEGPALDWDDVPKRVEAVIAAHIARLPCEQQDLLTVASIEGEEFHAEVAARVLGRRAEEVLSSLSGALSEEHRLLRSHSLRRVGEQTFSRYRFRHYLFQHCIYQRLDPVRRAHLHGQVAATLEALGAAPSGLPEVDINLVMADDRSDLFAGSEPVVSEGTMAWHWEEAGMAEKAALWHGFAGRRAIVFSFAYGEVLSRMARALALLATLPESPQRMLVQERCYHTLAWAREMVAGWPAPEAGEAWKKALALAEEVGDHRLVADALTWLCIYHRERGELDAAVALGERAVALAQGGLPGWVMWVEGELARALVLRGELGRASRLLEPRTERLLHTGSIPPPWTNIFPVVEMPWVLWCLGYPDRALEVGCAALQMISRERNSFQIGIEVDVIYRVCLVHRLRREVEGVKQGLQMLQSLVEEHRTTSALLPMVATEQGWVHVQTGQVELGIAEIRQGQADWRGGAANVRAPLQVELVDALGRAGQAEEGLAILGEALALLEVTQERWDEAELHRLQGALLLQRGSDPQEVEACFRQAIVVAQGQQAKSWELRATTSLARLLRDQGRAAEAQEMLSAIYGWFTEGFDTPDLQEARALLDELQDMTANRED